MVGIPFYDEYVEKAALEYLDKPPSVIEPFFMSVNFMKVHQPNMPHPDFQGKSLSKSKYADSIVENDTRIGRIMDKIRALGLDKNTYVFWTTDNGAWQDVYPGRRLHAVPRHQGHRARGRQSRSVARLGAGKIKAGSRNSDIVGGLDYMATFAALAGVKLPKNDREGEPIIFDSYDMSPVLFGTGKSERKTWFYFTENELTPGAARVGNYKAVFNLRGDDGASTGGLAVDSNLGWKGAEVLRRHRSPGLRPLAGPAGALRHLHEQLHGTYLDAGHDQRGHQGTDADLSEISPAQAPERRLRGPDHHHAIPTVPASPRAACEGGLPDRHAHRQLGNSRRNRVSARNGDKTRSWIGSSIP